MYQKSIFDGWQKKAVRDQIKQILETINLKRINIFKKAVYENE